MAKSIKRVSLCFVLAITLVFTMMPLSAHPAKASDGAMEKAITKSAAGEAKAQNDFSISIPDITLETNGVSKRGKTLKADGDYQAKGINYSSDTDKLSVSTVSYNKQASINTYDYCTITAKATGKMYVALKTAPTNEFSVKVAVGTKSSSTFNISNYTYISPNSTEDGFGCIDVVKGKTYILGFCSTSEAGTIAFAPYVIPYSTRDLPAGKAMIASGVKGASNSTSTVLYKIVPKKSGYISVALSDGGDNTYGKVTLLNSKKKTVSSKLSYFKGSKYSYVVFGVKKGQPYYLKVSDCSGYSSKQYMYAIAYKLKAGKIRKNTKRSRAVKLKRKAKYTVTTVPAKGKKGKDWYKFKVKKKRVTQINVDASAVKSGSMKITVYYGRKKIATKTVYNGEVNPFKVTYSTTWGKAKKGTYYVVISKSAKMNGQYRIKYVK